MASSSPAAAPKTNVESTVGIGFRSHINWPLLHFPPINLWIMPAWNSRATNDKHSHQEMHHA